VLIYNNRLYWPYRPRPNATAATPAGPATAYPDTQDLLDPQLGSPYVSACDGRRSSLTPQTPAYRRLQNVERAMAYVVTFLPGAARRMWRSS
jgi:hypothetical protein